ncbi:MAG TPA: alpha/beta hydrolase [Dongiaceae bacterium]|nr:alpha/beta hydrolase [Dongiaceae bacterium]
MLRLGLWWRALVAIVGVTLRRVRRGRALPGWTWSHEVIATGMKREFARLARLPWDVQRDTWRALALPAFTVRGVRFDRTTLGGRGAVWITPRGLNRGDEPILFYLHGGAYHFGSIEEYLDYVARLARAARAKAIVVDYRLAPEHPFPAAFDDALTAYEALLDSGVPASKVIVIGDSAGGGLTAALLVALRTRGLPLPAAGVMVCPWVDLGAQGGSLVSKQAHDVFTPELVEGWARSALAGADARDPRVSPLHAELKGLPPLLVQVGGAEMIVDQVVAFADRARAAGVDVRLRVWESCFHDWPVYAAVLADGRRAIDEVGAFVRTLK